MVAIILLAMRRRFGAVAAGVAGGVSLLAYYAVDVYDDYQHSLYGWAMLGLAAGVLLPLEVSAGRRLRRAGEPLLVRFMASLSFGIIMLGFLATAANIWLTSTYGVDQPVYAVLMVGWNVLYALITITFFVLVVVTIAAAARRGVVVPAGRLTSPQPGYAIAHPGYSATVVRGAAPGPAETGDWRRP